MNERNGEKGRSLGAIARAAPDEGKKRPRRGRAAALSRDFTDYFVNFNLYACPLVVLPGSRRLRATRERRAANDARASGEAGNPSRRLARRETRCDTHIRISDRRYGEAPIPVNCGDDRDRRDTIRLPRHGKIAPIRRPAIERALGTVAVI